MKPAANRSNTSSYYIIHFIVLIALLFLPCFSVRCSVHACSPSDFVLDDFATRCKDLSGKVRDTELAHRMGFPDAASRSALLLDAWLSFFLDHGVTPPPVYASMTGPAWENGMRNLGSRIGGLGRGEPTSREALDLMTLPLELLAQPDHLFPFQNALATVTRRIREVIAGTGSASRLLSPAQLAADHEIGQSFALISGICENAPALRARLSTLYSSLTALSADTRPNTASAAGTVDEEMLLNDEDRRALMELHLDSLRDEVAFLSPIAFWQLQPAASPTSHP